MRFIKTKNFILDLSVYSIVKETDEQFKLYYEPKGNASYWTRVNKSDIVKQSNCLEDLFHRFVVYGNSHYKIYTRQQFFKFSREEILDKLNRGYLIYGANWRSKGLIYDAQLNKEGEWKLL